MSDIFRDLYLMDRLCRSYYAFMRGHNNRGYRYVYVLFRTISQAFLKADSHISPTLSKDYLVLVAIRFQKAASYFSPAFFKRKLYNISSLFNYMSTPTLYPPEYEPVRHQTPMLNLNPIANDSFGEVKLPSEIRDYYLEAHHN